MAEDCFYALLKVCDSFDLVMLEREFAQQVKGKLAGNPSSQRKPQY